MLEGNAVFSPIAHSHGVADYMPEHIRLNGDFWMEQDLPLLAKCDEIVVLCLEGWEQSSGVQQEIAFARERGIPVRRLQE
jgi:nucleoside 2-deoxyribosyltransferase